MRVRYDATEHLVQVKASLQNAANLKAAIAYYGALTIRDVSNGGGPYSKEEQAAWQLANRPTLYLHGSADGCIGADLIVDAVDMLAPDSRLEVVQDVGHFLHVERPIEVHRRVLAWVTA